MLANRQIGRVLSRYPVAVPVKVLEAISDHLEGMGDKGAFGSHARRVAILGKAHLSERESSIVNTLSSLKAG
jgi:hypothetical protein